MAAVGGLPAGLGTKVGRANLAFSATSVSVVCCALAVGGPGQYANAMSVAKPNAALRQNALAVNRQQDPPPLDGEGLGVG